VFHNSDREFYQGSAFRNFVYYFKENVKFTAFDESSGLFFLEEKRE